MSDTLNTVSSSFKLSITLLKEVTITLDTSDGLKYRVPISPNAKRIQLLAYLAWRRDEKVPRKDILDALFLPDLFEKETTVKKASPRQRSTTKNGDKRLSKDLRTKFDSHKGLLRRDIRSVVKQINIERTTDLLPTDLDPLEQEHRHYWLSSLCQVTDLETVETHAQVIQEAEMLGNMIPEHVKVACDAVIAAYSGDFLEDMIRTYPEEFRPLARSWVRKPYTLYRESYLQALWYAAEYERQKSQTNEESAERAANLFRKYAMHACNSRLDTYVLFKTEKRRAGHHVSQSEEAMCYSLAIYKERGSRQVFEECKQAYVQQMERVSRGIWKPEGELREIMQSVNW